MLLVEVVRAAAEVLLRGEHLAASHAVFAEQFVIAVDQFRLSDSGIKLPGGDGVQLLAGFYLAASRGDRPGRDEDDLDSFTMEVGHLVHQGRHPGNIQRAVFAGEYVTADLYCYSCKQICHIYEFLSLQI